MTSLKNLFGEVIKEKPKKITRTQKALEKYDRDTFSERLERLNYISKRWSKNLIIAGDMEFVFTLSEIKQCFIAGHFIATILLTQSFIEKIFVSFFEKKGLVKEATNGLGIMIKYARKHDLISSYVLNKVDNLRLIRNPFIHVKDYDYPHNLSHRIFENKKQADLLLEDDAMDAIDILTYIIEIRELTR